MTVHRERLIHKFTGLAADTKPVAEIEGGSALSAGCEFYEADTRRSYIFDGSTSWYDNGRYYLDDRVDIAITTTSSHLYSGDSVTKRGDLLRQYVITLGASTNAPTRTLSIVDSNSVSVWASTAITGTTGAVNISRLLPTSEQIVLDGAYTVAWTLSTNSATTGIYDYYTFGFDRG